MSKIWICVYIITEIETQRKPQSATSHVTIGRATCDGLRMLFHTSLESASSTLLDLSHEAYEKKYSNQN